jgi:hypothetical protein
MQCCWCGSGSTDTPLEFELVSIIMAFPQTTKKYKILITRIAKHSR